jgi:YVTN family beta-propeller protein
MCFTGLSKNKCQIVEIDVRVARELTFLMIFQITLLVLFNTLSNDAFAQPIRRTLHDRTLYEAVNQSSGLDKIPHIDVGSFPEGLDVNENTDTVYVANALSDTVSVISGENNTKIGEDIAVGMGPVAVDVNENTDTVYVANHFSNTISVISGENNTKIGEDIAVGMGPVAVDVNENTDTVYVANVDSDSVSVIDTVTNKVVAGITFHVNPFKSGSIVCEHYITPSMR